MADPTPEEIVQIAKSGTTGQVKTLTDLRFEKNEARIADLENKLTEMFRINEEYRSANSEMFAYIQTSNAPQAAPPSSSLSTVPASAQPGAPVSAQIMRDEAAVAAELAATKISDPTGADIVSFALLMVSILGTSNLVHQIAMYNRAKEEEKQNENNK